VNTLSEYSLQQMLFCHFLLYGSTGEIHNSSWEITKKDILNIVFVVPSSKHFAVMPFTILAVITFCANFCLLLFAKQLHVVCHFHGNSSSKSVVMLSHGICILSHNREMCLVSVVFF
jgi:hypothetical protein